MKLSIIVPVYNVEPYLRKCVDSILAQTVTDFELILVDDGSSDGSPAICDAYARSDSRVLVVHQINGGISTARNTGLDLAKGEYIGFVDSDDYVAENMYEVLLRKAEETNADISALGYNEVDINGHIVMQRPMLDHDLVYHREAFIENFFPDLKWKISPCVWNKIFKKRLFEQYRFPVDKIYEDSFAQLPLFDLCETISVTNQYLYFYLVNRPDSIMNRKMNKDSFQLLDVCHSQYQFFFEKGLTYQQEFALNEYLDKYLKLTYSLTKEHKHLKSVARQYRRQLLSYGTIICTCSGISKMKKLIVVLVHINRPLAYRLTKTYFPECLPEILR